MEYWTTKYRLFISIKLDWEKFEQSNIELPLKIFPKCSDWRYEISQDKKTAIFLASWDLRKITKNILNKGLEELKPYIIQ